LIVVPEKPTKSLIPNLLKEKDLVGLSRSQWPLQGKLAMEEAENPLGQGELATALYSLGMLCPYLHHCCPLILWLSFANH